MARLLSLLVLLALIALPGGIFPAPVPPTAENAVPGPQPVAQTGTPVLVADWRSEIAFQSKFGAAKSSAPEDGVQLITAEQPENTYDLQGIVLNHIPLKKGDTLLLRFAARSLKSDVNSGNTKLKVGFSKNAPDWDSSYNAEIGIGVRWERFDIPFACQNDFASREAKVFFEFGYPVQTAEIADVQLLRYDAPVRPESLPKTARRADAVTPEALAAEIARIGKMHREMAAVTNPAPAHGRTLYVSPSGPAGGNGTVQKPFTSLPTAVAAAQPGDTVLVAPGEYREPHGVKIPVSGKPDAWIKIKAAPGSSRPKLISSDWQGFEVADGRGYIELSGFELTWVHDPKIVGEGGIAVHGVGVALTWAAHHVRIINNVIHGFGTAGIASLDSDYLTIEGNQLYDNAKTSPYGGSAIALNRAYNFDTAPGYHNIIRNNSAWDNELMVNTNAASGGNGRVITDGNGIIIDSFSKSRKNPRIPYNSDSEMALATYHGRTLIENNLMYDNGGRGIHIFRASNVDIINNTCYMNQKSADINGGEFTGIEGDHLNFLNNIAYGRGEKRGNTQDGSTHVIWSHNLFYNVADVLQHDGLIEANPRFVAPALNAKPEGFRLKSDSPALRKGIPSVAPADDLTGAARPAKGPIDLGAYQLSK